MEPNMSISPIEENADSPAAANPAAVLEAILFAAGCPVDYEKIGEALSLSPGAVKKLAREMQSRYADSGIELILLEHACQLCTRACYESYIKTALHLRRTGTLSNASLEVLAIVAYHQPVTRAYIEQVRGVDSSYAVSSLCDRELLEPRGRLDVPGRPMLYGTTDTFLRCFGLSSLQELPTQPELLDVMMAQSEAPACEKQNVSKIEATPSSAKESTVDAEPSSF